VIGRCAGFSRVELLWVGRNSEGTTLPSKKWVNSSPQRVARTCCFHTRILLSLSLREMRVLKW